MNQGIHTIDLLVWMLGEPVEVYARTACLAHQRIEVEDTAVATIAFAGGALGVVHGTTAAYPGLTARLQVHGDRGSAVIDGDELTYFHAAASDADSPDYGAGATANQAADLVPQQASTPSAGADPGSLSDAHADQYRDFLDAVTEGRRPVVTVTEAITTLAVVRAIYDSARTGLPVPVELPTVSAVENAPA
jgi:predicted dehydrogenase